MENFGQPRNILIGVDIQNDFINGSLAVTEGEQVVAPINLVAGAVRNSGGDVIFTGDKHPLVTPHFDTWPVHCVEGTEGAAFHHDLIIEDQDIVISKGMGQTDGYSGWEGVTAKGNTLEAIITPQTPREKVRIFIGGLATDYCVKATALDIAARFGNDERVSLYLLRDAIRAVGLAQDDEQAALDAMKAAQYFAVSSLHATSMIETML